jgi:DNA mismatch repair protein MSH5
MEFSMDGSSVEHPGEVFMAVEMKNNNFLGCAYCTSLDGRMYLLEDLTLADLETIESLLIHIQPTTILLHGRTSETLVGYFEKNAGNRPDGGRFACS